MSQANWFDAWTQAWSTTTGKTISLNLPGSGSIGEFTYNPSTIWEAPSFFRGNMALESMIYREIASPGKQLGKLVELVRELGELQRDKLQRPEVLDELACIDDKVKRLTTPVRENARQTVREDLKKLLATDAEFLEQLIKEFTSELALKRADPSAAEQP